MPALTDDQQAQIRDQAARILSSATFAGSERHKRFLRFVIDQALKGETDKLNEFVLGFEVFNKNASFDPRIDSIVRVEARRLRERLKKYYQAEGGNDPIIITLRPRSFIPEFETAQAEKPPSPSRLRVWLPSHKMIAVAAVALVLGAIGGAVVLSLRDRRPAPPQMSSILVLPFENLTPSPSQEMLGDGISDSIITELASLPGLRVISRGSTLQFKAAGRTPAQFAADLQVDYVVEGSVQIKADQLVVSAKLTDTHSQSYVWAQTQQTDLKKLPDFERELANSIASRIHVPLPPSDAGRTVRKRAATFEAYSAFLKGQYFMYQWDSGGAEKSVALFEEALRGDPNYAPAWAWLSQAYLLLIQRDDGQDAAMVAKGRMAAQKSLSLDGDLAEAHAAVASYAAFDWDWPGAEREFRRAIELDPGWPQGYLMYARMYLIPIGRVDQAMHEIMHARELDPLTQYTRLSLAEVLYLHRDYARCIAEYEDLRKPEARGNPPDGMYFVALSLTGQAKRAAAGLREEMPPGDSWGPPQAVLGYLDAKSGNTQAARATLNRLLAESRKRYVPPMPLAILSTGLNDHDAAFDQLRVAVTRHVPSIVSLGVDPVFDPLRSDPRYDKILGDIGLKNTR